MTTAGSEIEQIAAFEERFAKAQATDVIDLSWGFALLQSDFPGSYQHNRVVVTSAVSSAEVLAATDQVLGGAGLNHRYISVVDDAVGADLEPDLTTAGYEAEALTTMIYRGAVAEPPEHSVQEVTLEVLRSAVIRDWKVDLPDATDDVLAQLADRMTLYQRGADVTMLAVHEGPEVAARAELYVDQVNQLAQIESVMTHADYRGRGYARSLLRDAQRRAHRAGARLLFLEASLDDWPREWYRRLGYVEARRTRDYTRFSVSGGRQQS